MSADSGSQRGCVVLLNGPPSCGKTTLAKALQNALAEPYFHLSLDDFRAGYLERYWRVDNGSLFERAMRGHLAALRATALAGNDLIAEAVITPPRVPLYVRTFEDLSVTFVGVRCPLEVAVTRERNRGDRLLGPIELPVEAFDSIHSHGEYDIEVDTSTASADQLAADLATRLHSSPNVAFAHLRARTSG